jgi:PhnB protein
VANEEASVPVEYKPSGYHTVTPYLIVDGAERLMAFIADALDGTETVHMQGPDGRIAHAEMRVGDSLVMLADTPEPGGETSAMLHLYVPDSDATYRRAMEAGATSLREPQDEFYGDRMSGVQDSTGTQWYFATHVEDVSDEEMARRADQAVRDESV